MLKLMIYEWVSRLGEPPYASLRATGERVELSDLIEGSLIEVEGKREVVIAGTTHPIYSLKTVRKAQGGVGIEMVNRIQGGGCLVDIIPHFGHWLDLYLRNGRGYLLFYKMLAKFGCQPAR